MLRQLVGLHQALLQFGAIGHVVEDDQAADLFLILRYQRRDRDVQRRVAQPRRADACPLPLPLPFDRATAGRGRLQHEFVDVVDAGLAAHPVELLGRVRRGTVRASRRPTACSRVMPVSCSICVFQLSDPIFQVRRQNSDVDRFDDVLAEFLEPLVLLDLALQGAVQRRVLDRDADVAGQRQQQFHVDARQIIAGRRSGSGR